MKACSKKDCQNRAAYQVCLSLSVHANHTPALSSPILYLCEDHKNDITFESITSHADNWEKLCRGFTGIGRMAPVKEFSKIIIEPIK